MKTPTSTKKTLAGLAGLALVALPLAACGSSSDNSSSSSSSSTGAPKPVAAIAAIPANGGTTEVTLDAGFVKAITGLGLTPGAFGTGKLTSTSLIFPITGGNVTVFKPGTVSPYVIGQVQHEGSGFTLAAGGTTVTVSDLNVDPGASVVYGDVYVGDKLAAPSAPVFNLDGRTLKPIKVVDGNAVLQGTKVEVSDTAAGLLDSTFNTDAVKGGLLVGIATITVPTS